MTSADARHRTNHHDGPRASAVRRFPASPARRAVLAAVGGGALLAAAPAVVAGDPATPVTFTVADLGLAPAAPAPGMGTGIACADVDGDGLVDLFVPEGSGTPNRLYLAVARRDGTVGYEDVAAAAGLAVTESTRCGLLFDLDGDGDLDLVTSGDDPDAPTSHRAYRQVPPRAGERVRFEAIDGAAGLAAPLPGPIQPGIVHRGGLSAGDLDGDGDLDLVSCLWNGRLQVFRNDAGTFVDATDESGITAPEPAPFTHQALLHDFDRDGRLDVYVAVDYRWNGLWLNDGFGDDSGEVGFVDVAPQAGLDNAWNDMGLALGDVDGDGDFDLYVTNITNPGVHNALFVNPGTAVPGDVGTWTERAQDAGVDDGGWAWGTTFLDLDCDGRLDVACTNGWTSPDWVDDRTRLWWNRGTAEGGDDLPTFAEIAAAAGVDDTDYGSTLLAFDRDLDGDEDMVLTALDAPLRVLDAAPVPGVDRGHWLLVRPRMAAGPNRRAIGAEIEVTCGDRTFVRAITAGTSYLGQAPAEAFVGLGACATADRVLVRWPGGGETCLEDVAADRVVTIRDDAGGPCAGPACPGDVDGDGLVGPVDLALLVGAWGPCPGAPAACPADVDASGTVDFADLLALVAGWGDCG